MSLRDYFAAHAPAEPQAWFEPAMPAPRPNPEIPRAIADPALREDVCIAMDCDTDPRTPEGAAWLRKHHETWKAAEAWDVERKKQRLIQWPYAWADAQLAERSKP